MTKSVDAPQNSIRNFFKKIPFLFSLYHSVLRFKLLANSFIVRSLEKPAEKIATRFRPFWLLKFVKTNSRQFLGSFDPNNLRKKYNTAFPQNLVLFDAYQGRYQVDINDHLGYRFFMNDGFDNFLPWLGEKLNIQKNDILLDIGANIGSVCIPFAKKFDVEIIAIEASKSNCAVLLKNAALNMIKMQCHCCCAVDREIYQKEKYLEFFINNGNMAASSIFKAWNPSLIKKEIEFAKTLVVDDLFKSEEEIKKIKLIKIDVEGAEEIVFRGMENLLNSGIPVVFEYRRDVMVRDLQDDGSKMISLLEKTHKIFGVEGFLNGYALVHFDPKISYENAVALPLSEIDKMDKVING